MCKPPAIAGGDVSSEEQLAPMTTELFTRARRTARGAVTLREVQAGLRADELLLEIALAEPASFAIVASRSTARVQRLPGRSHNSRPGQVIGDGRTKWRGCTDGVKALSATLLGDVRELSTHRRIVISAEGGLQQVPFELLKPSKLTPSTRYACRVVHAVGWNPNDAANPSGFTRRGPYGACRRFSPEVPVAGTTGPPAGPVTRGVYDLDATKLRPLPLAAEEAESVRAAFGARIAGLGEGRGNRGRHQITAAGGLPRAASPPRTGS